MAWTPIPSYIRRDGTAVRAHKRSGNLSRTSRLKPQDTLGALVEVNENAAPPVQMTTEEIDAVASDLKKGLRDLDEKYELLDHPLAVAGVGGAGFLTFNVSASLGAAGVGVLAAPVVGLFLGVIARPFVVRAWKRRKLKKEASERTNKGEASPEYLAYAQETIKDLPRQMEAPEYHGVETLDDSIRRKQKAICHVDSNGLGRVRLEESHEAGNVSFTMKSEKIFHPKAKIKDNFETHICLPGVNLRDADLSDSRFLLGVNFEGADLRNANLSNAWIHAKTRTSLSNFRGADLRGANLSGASLIHADLQGANLSGCNIDDGTSLPRNLRGVTMGWEQWEVVAKRLDSGYATEYDSHTFDETVKILGISEKQFEHLVLSGVIGVRDNKRKKKVFRDFKTDDHHVPCWELDKIKKILTKSEA